MNTDNPHRCPSCHTALLPLSSFRVDRTDSDFSGRTLCRGCFRREQYRESNRNPYGSHSSESYGQPLMPHEMRG